MSKNILNRQVLEELGQKVANVAQTGVTRSKQLAEFGRLKAANHNEETAIKRAYIEIGKLYYAEHGDAPDGPYVALCSRISKSQDTICRNLAQIEELKASAGLSEEDFGEDDIVVEEPCEVCEEPAVPEAAPAEESTAVEAPAQEQPEEDPIPDEE